MMIPSLGAGQMDGKNDGDNGGDDIVDGSGK